MSKRINEITAAIVDAAIKVHSKFGVGLLESVYMGALAIELRRRGLKVQREVPVEVEWDGEPLGVGFRMDMLVEDLVVVEGKAVETNQKVHLRQLRTQVRLAKKQVGLLLNFGMALMKDGIFRHVEGLEE